MVVPISRQNPHPTIGRPSVANPSMWGFTKCDLVGFWMPVILTFCLALAHRGTYAIAPTSHVRRLTASPGRSPHERCHTTTPESGRQIVRPLEICGSLCRPPHD